MGHLVQIGNATSAPELRYTAAGNPVANFDIAINDRRYNDQTGKWEDGEVTFLRVNAWGRYAKNCADSITKGAEVFIYGDVKVRKWENKHGEPRTSVEVDVKENSGAVGPTLRWQTARLEKNPRPSDNRRDPASYGTGGFGGGDQAPPF